MSKTHDQSAFNALRTSATALIDEYVAANPKSAAAFQAAKTAGVENIIGHRTAKLSDSDGVSLKTFRELGIASN